MNKKFNIIKLSGFKGLFLLLFIGLCLITGFLVFPGWVCMNFWNFVASYFFELPRMTMLHGVLLWCIIALSLYALNKDNVFISFSSASSNEEKIKKILSNEAKIQEIKNLIEQKNKEIDKELQKNKEEKEEDREIK